MSQATSPDPQAGIGATLRELLDCKHERSRLIDGSRFEYCPRCGALGLPRLRATLAASVDRAWTRPSLIASLRRASTLPEE